MSGALWGALSILLIVAGLFVWMLGALARMIEPEPERYYLIDVHSRVLDLPKLCSIAASSALRAVIAARILRLGLRVAGFHLTATVRSGWGLR